MTKCNPGSFTEKGSVTNELVKRYDDKLQEIMNQKWTVGAMDRGMGRYSYAVIIGESGESFIEVKHMCQREIVEHLVELHNEWLKSQVTDQVI